MKYHYYIWDWNGTLLNDAVICREVMNGLLKRRNLPIMSSRRYEDIFDFPVHVYYKRLGFDFQHESFEKLGTEFINEYERRKAACRLHTDARKILAALQVKKAKQAVLSAYRHETLVQLLDTKNLLGYFDWIVGADDHYAHGKAAQGTMLLGKISPLKGHTLMIGDTIHDYEVAKTIGVDCILVYSGHQARARLKACDCMVFDDLRHAGEWLMKAS